MGQALLRLRTISRCPCYHADGDFVEDSKTSVICRDRFSRDFNIGECEILPTTLRTIDDFCAGPDKQFQSIPALRSQSSTRYEYISYNQSQTLAMSLRFMHDPHSMLGDVVQKPTAGLGKEGKENKLVQTEFNSNAVTQALNEVKFSPRYTTPATYNL